MRPPAQTLRRAAALLLLAGHVGWASVRSWKAIDWRVIEAPRVDWITHIEPIFMSLREALGETPVVSYVQLPKEDERWNVTTRFQLQYFLAPVLLDAKGRHPTKLVEQACVEQRCSPGPELAPGRARQIHQGLLLVEGGVP